MNRAAQGRAPSYTVPSLLDMKTLQFCFALIFSHDGFPKAVSVGTETLMTSSVMHYEQGWEGTLVMPSP